MDVLLVDDHPIIHETLRAMVRSLRPDGGFSQPVRSRRGLVRGAAAGAARARAARPRAAGCSGMDALVKFRQAVPNARVVVISADEDHERVRAALSEGAASYVPKTLRPKAMVDALRTILDGGMFTAFGGPGPLVHCDKCHKTAHVGRGTASRLAQVRRFSG
jgi:DNA-binding NarL/FixJ family response regulator